MTIQNIPNPNQPWPGSRRQLAVALASVGLGVVLGFTAAESPLFEEADAPVAAPLSSSTNIQPGSGLTAEIIQPSAREEQRSKHGRTGIVDFDPELPAGSTGIAPGSGLTADAIQPSSRERKLSPTGRAGFVDSDPSVLYPGAPAGQ